MTEEKQPWDGLERRGEAKNILYDLIRENSAKLDTLADLMDGHAAKLEAHIVGEEAIMKGFIAAFPGDDPHGHRAYHEAEIARIKERADFWSKLRLELTKWGVIGFLGWAAVSLWGAFLKGPK